MRNYKIYKVTNTVNSKVYIGKTNNFNKRKREHTVYDINNDNIFHKALRKYGLKAFKWEIIDHADTLDEANEKERHYIKKHKSFKPKGYNMTKGGDGGSMWNARPVVVLDLKGNYIAEFDSAGECERKMGFLNSCVLECCKGKINHHRKHLFMFLDDYKENGPKKYKKQKKFTKPIIQCDLEGNFIKKYNSGIEASKETGISRGRISSALNGHSKTAGDYIWVHEENFSNLDISKYKRDVKGIPIYQLNIDTGEIVNEFDRIADAGRYLGKNYKSIHKVLDMPERSAYGYRWVTKSLYTNTEVN